MFAQDHFSRTVHDPLLSGRWIASVIGCRQTRTRLIHLYTIFVYHSNRVFQIANWICSLKNLETILRSISIQATLLITKFILLILLQNLSSFLMSQQLILLNWHFAYLILNNLWPIVCLNASTMILIYLLFLCCVRWKNFGFGRGWGRNSVNNFHPTNHLRLVLLRIH